jgi:hypothetical protein
MKLFYASVLMAAILLASVVTNLSQWWDHRNEVNRLAEQIALKDSVIVVTETAKAALSGEVDSSKRLAAGIEKNLREALEKLKVKPLQVVRTVIVAHAETVFTVLRDTVEVDSAGVSRELWPFAIRQGRYTVIGEVVPMTRELGMEITQDPITLQIVTSETRSGNYLVSVDTGDSSLVISDIQSRTVRLRPPWFSRGKAFWLGAALSAGATAFILK